jgi:hypothetical protein
MLDTALLTAFECLQIIHLLYVFKPTVAPVTDTATNACYYEGIFITFSKNSLGFSSFNVLHNNIYDGNSWYKFYRFEVMITIAPSKECTGVRHAVG